ncbi:DMT family transporter [Robertkochia solimangrovi]|uniref:DMT family transporter n=1 Tax=Robertkochia solimangrovi TaxID=2213046 RepID=UPI00117F674B|nr:DMT family transporter [Robertkochia solimangrovi]TRZ43560.1 EamA-like transporter family protein [Robertkochia solimangrovi]
MKANLILILFAVLAGAVLPIQAGLNVQLGKSVHQPVFAAFASFLIGSIGLLIYLVIIKFDFGSVVQVREVSPTVWLAGILGAFYVAAVIVLAPKLGTALTFSLVVTGQMIISLVLDHYGLLSLPVQEINWQRLIGVVLLTAGVLMIRGFN